MGRVKIPIEYRNDDRARRVTLCKRKKGLYKKAEELAKLCGVEVSVVIIGDTCKPTQLVATGSGNFDDLPNTFRVLNQYSDLVTTKGDWQQSVDKTNREQGELLEKQRREIEELKRELFKTNPNSKLLVAEPESHQGSEACSEEEEDDDEAHCRRSAAAFAAVVAVAGDHSAINAKKPKIEANTFHEAGSQLNPLRTQLARSVSGNDVARTSPALSDLNELARQNSRELLAADLLARNESNESVQDLKDIREICDVSLGRTISAEFK